MGKRSKTGVLKRLREVKKAEKAAMKREELRTRKQTGVGPERPESTGAVIATAFHPELTQDVRLHSYFLDTLRAPPAGAG